MEKWLTVSGCHLSGGLARSKDEALVIAPQEGPIFGVNVGQPIVTSEEWGFCGVVA